MLLMAARHGMTRPDDPMSSFAKLALCLLTALVAGCASLPPLGNRSESTALRETGDTRLGRAIALVPGLPTRPPTSNRVRR